MLDAKILCDSISNDGIRLTSFELTCHRFVLSEFNTHRVFSRNSASSRAIPVSKQIMAIEDDLAYPVEFGTNQPGMQAGPPLEGDDLERARRYWKEASNDAILWAKILADKEDTNVHKQVTNRLLEPFMWHKIIVTSVDYENFFLQRCSPLAQPEIRAIADLMRDEYRKSTPTPIGWGEWHLPFIQPHEFDEFYLSDLKKISAARCARVSYLTHDGVRDVQKDLELYERLVTADPPHWSPLEHVATPYDDGLSEKGNFIEFKDHGYDDYYHFNVGWMPHGWAQLRHNL